MFPFDETISKRLAFLLCLSIFGWFSITGSFSWADIGIVTVDSLNLRPQRGVEKPPVMVLPKGSKVEILEKQGKWLRVRHNEITGYIRDQPNFLHVVRFDGENETQKFEKLSTESRKIGEKIAQSKVEIQTFTEKEASLLAKLNDIDRKVNGIRKKISSLQVEFSELDVRLAQNRQLLDNTSNKIASLSEYAKKRLVALYKIHRVGTLSVLASAESFSDLFLRKQALERVYAHNEILRKKLLSEKRNLREITDRMTLQRKEKLKIEQRLAEEIKTMAEEKENRSRLLAGIRRDKQMELSVLEAFKQAAALIQDKIKSLEKEKKSTPENFLPQKPFSFFKGLLNMPVKGKITLGFGPYRDEKLDLDHFSNGINILAEFGEPVRAVGSGRILFADWFKTYGNMVIIDHGYHFYTVYAHAQELFKAKGDRVESGEVIATVGDTGSISGPKLYFEVRHHGKPVDPADWINKG